MNERIERRTGRVLEHAAFLSVALLALVASRPVAGAVRSVPSAYASIQSAIDASVDGDVIEVAPGTYYESVDFRGRAVIVRSTDGPDVTILDAAQSGSAVVFRNGEDVDSVLRGFTLTHGIGTAYGTMRFGGAVLCDGTSPRILECIVEGNVADFGGGIACLAIAHPRLESLVVRGNSVFGRGGGIHLEDLSFAEILGCTIRENEANRTGGGISAVRAGGHVADCDIDDNFAVAGGGGVSLSAGSDAFLERNRFRSNESRSADGGGIRCIESSPILIDNVFERNRTGHDADGGAIYCTQAEPLIRGNVFVDNQADWDGGAIAAWSESTPVIEDNVFFGNRALHSGGAISISWNSSPEIRRNEIRGNGSDRAGGAISLTSFADALLEANEIVENTGSSGAGILVNESSPRLVGNVIARNVAREHGGGLFVIFESTVTSVHDTITGNSAVSTGGGMLASRSDFVATNTILRDNDAPEAPDVRTSSDGTFEASHCVLADAWPGEGNRVVDPGFVRAEAGDFRLRFDSLCVDAGDPSVPGLPQKDKDGTDRIVDGDGDGVARPDIGAVEMAPRFAARYGSVGLGRGSVEDVLFVNDVAGDGHRVIEIPVGSSVEVDVRPPAGGPDPAPFVLYAWLGEPDDDSVVVEQPRGLGLLCFGSPMTAGIQPTEVWNNLGHGGALGRPTRSSSAAPSTPIRASRGSIHPLRLTLQGFIADRDSAADGPLSVTNAVVVRFVDVDED